MTSYDYDHYHPDRAGRDYDGVRDAEILARDGWQCRMETCYCPAGRAMDRALPRTAGNPWSASIDHVIRLAAGGTDTADNKRAAHRFCNTEAGRRALATIGELCPELGTLLDPS